MMEDGVLEKIKNFLVEKGQVGRDSVGYRVRTLKNILNLDASARKIGREIKERDWSVMANDSSHPGRNYAVKEEFVDEKTKDGGD